MTEEPVYPSREWLEWRYKVMGYELPENEFICHPGTFPEQK